MAEHPHDSIARFGFSDIRVARDFIHHYLPDNIREQINLEQLSICTGHFVDEDLETAETDILYAAPYQNPESGSQAYIHLLIEHQSTADYWLSFRRWKYSVKIWEQHRSQYPEDKQLPVIIPIVLYNGERKYHHSTDFLELFGKYAELAKEILYAPFRLVDLTEIPDETLREHHWCGILETALKHCRIRDTKTLLEKIAFSFHQLWREQQAETYLTGMLNYLLQCSKAESIEELVDYLETFQKPLEATMTNAAEQLIEYGIERGMEQGIERGIEQGLARGKQAGRLEERRVLAQQLMHRFHNLPEVAELMNLSPTELQSLLEQP